MDFDVLLLYVKCSDAFYWHYTAGLHIMMFVCVVQCLGSALFHYNVAEGCILTEAIAVFFHFVLS